MIWMLHSAWALAVGTVVVLLARERYHLVLWVVLFLVLAWTSTLFLGRAVARGVEPPKLAHEVTSYFTRILYQETLFFLLPFYAYSTVVESPNVLFLILLGGLAILSCIDLIFDRWLRTRPVFVLMFFAIVAFAGINLLLPLLVGLSPERSLPLAALLAVGGAAPLAVRMTPNASGGRLRLVVGGLVMLAVPVGLPRLIPPVPLRLERAPFAPGIARRTLEVTKVFSDRVAAAMMWRWFDPRGRVGRSIVRIV
jgi:hypothetical protein